MAAPLFNKRVEDPADLAFREGRRPGDNNRLGPNQNAITNPKDFANAFVQMRFNPDSKTFWNSSVFGSDVAGASQDKINRAGSTDYPAFTDPRDNTFAWDFLNKYSGPGGAIERGLVEPERAVTKEGLARLMTQPAALGSTQKDPNTVNKFPNQGVSVG
jgi:hypothetical protein